MRQELDNLRGDDPSRHYGQSKDAASVWRIAKCFVESQQKQWVPHDRKVDQCGDVYGVISPRVLPQSADLKHGAWIAATIRTTDPSKQFLVEFLPGYVDGGIHHRVFTNLEEKFVTLRSYPARYEEIVVGVEGTELAEEHILVEIRLLKGPALDNIRSKRTSPTGDDPYAAIESLCADSLHVVAIKVQASKEIRPLRLPKVILLTNNSLV